MTYQDLSPEALELEFNPRATAKNLDERLAASASASAEARAGLDCVLDVRYGPGENETLDIFPAADPGSDRGSPVQLFIHGGYWRAMDKSDYSFIADVFQPAGATTVLINYDLCPTVTLDTIVEQSNRSIAWIWRNIADYGGDPGRLYVSGNSAGGHLTAMALAHDWEGEGLPADIIKGAVPITGVMDCEPVLDITVNAEVRLEPEAARRLSPLRNPPRRALPLLVAVGGAEPRLWIKMSEDYAALCREHGIECEYMAMPGHDHFDIGRAVGDPRSPLAQAMLRMMGL
ncbi:MAG: alpha/beta hydrolase [Immundisolibacterales bacterium]|nr:alpha/beta hydrolase [Immundisolibacterales bacterium]